ncbi:hypothetical protein ONZ60_03650 [Aeromonas salmonicida]|uniref:hypothetical protein n=1 Tax=Aeromonas salmonicida TaxID=645 RepID=UPI001E2D8BD1|nr:hypothetical protein [Aeromonas salmonicida]MCK3681289.1 hypothetical protein [Aeromonas salmonicida subsp. salmonicida]MCR4454865.1 hypothetical protein [Aeromonas salmonicida]UDQ60171.1 hypothetical protein LJF99_10340 [Aeromonas salmonicida subsp. salmonicida]UYZ30258.1 hypothetical protein AXW80_00650 [Aeromonas salmonicida subsp. salmonicida]WCB52760.1 hypothetical protein PI861_12070 [Aeromonas salmonicida subsp. salmonicida]
MRDQRGFAVVAYGKIGGIALGYGSGLVFSPTATKTGTSHRQPPPVSSTSRLLVRARSI